MSFGINLAATIFSIAVSLFLFAHWYRQTNRLYVDLPLMFSITFIAEAINLFMLSLIDVGLIEETLPVFKIRAFIILWSALPLLGASMNIWSHRSQRTQLKVLFALAVYWVIVIILGPTRDIIILLHVPILLSLMVLLLATFAITWKTGRLKEVRSDLMLVSILIVMATQVSRVSLMKMGLDYVAAILNAIAIIVAALALINPWHTPVDLATTKPPVPVQVD